MSSACFDVEDPDCRVSPSKSCDRAREITLTLLPSFAEGAEAKVRISALPLLKLDRGLTVQILKTPIRGYTEIRSIQTAFTTSCSTLTRSTSQVSSSLLIVYFDEYRAST